LTLDWKLGRLLTKVERRKGERTSDEARPTFQKYIKSIGLGGTAAKEAQRIGAIPPEKLDKAFEEATREGVLNTRESMFLFARPWWKIKVRATRHQKRINTYARALESRKNSLLGNNGSKRNQSEPEDEPGDDQPQPSAEELRRP
jgi:hypothetical protein